MSKYNEEQISSFEDDRRKWLDRGSDLTTTFLAHKFKSAKAEKFSREGLARRLSYLAHIFQRIGQVYPPNCVGASRNDVRDAEVFLQSFTMNVFGSIDNLAWIWALENDVRNTKGDALGPSEMVFSGKRSKILRGSLTAELQEAIDEAHDWFETIGVYRHGVAHQIPLYIPRNLNSCDVEKVQEFQSQISQAMLEDDWRKVSELHSRIYALGDFGPYMALCEPHTPMLLHPQMVCDYATVIHLGELVVRGLE